MALFNLLKSLKERTTVEKDFQDQLLSFVFAQKKPVPLTKNNYIVNDDGGYVCNVENKPRFFGCKLDLGLVNHSRKYFIPIVLELIFDESYNAGIKLSVIVENFAPDDTRASKKMIKDLVSDMHVLRYITLDTEGTKMIHISYSQCKKFLSPLLAALSVGDDETYKKDVLFDQLEDRIPALQSLIEDDQQVLNEAENYLSRLKGSKGLKSGQSEILNDKCMKLLHFWKTQGEILITKHAEVIKQLKSFIDAEMHPKSEVD